MENHRDKPASWIETIGPDRARGRLAETYRRLAGGGPVDHILQVHGLRPHTLDGHLALYRSILHHPRNRLDRALAEAVGVLVSRINGCTYCVAHHAEGLRRAAPERAEALLGALESGEWSGAFTPAEQAALGYAEALTRSPAKIGENHIQALREAGFDDGEILELNQVTAYFAYANRTVLGLGVTLEPGRDGA